MQQELAARAEQAAQEHSVAAGAAAAEALARQGELARRVQALDEVLVARSGYEQRAARVARMALAVSALGEVLAGSSGGGSAGGGAREGATGAIAALRVALSSGPAAAAAAATAASSSSGDAIVDLALASLPPAVHGRGVARTSELRGSFAYVSSVGRRAAPSGSGMLGKALSGVGASIVLPAQDLVGEVRGLLCGGVRRAAGALREAAAPYESLQPLVRGVEEGWASLSAFAQAQAAQAKAGVLAAWEGAGSAGREAAPGAPAAAAAAAAGAGAPAAPGSPLAALPLPRAEELKATAEATLAKGREVFSSSEAGVRRAAAIFDAAEEAVAREDLARAIALLGALRQEEGQELTMQWVAAAEQRVAVDRAFRLIRARTDLLVASLY